MRIETDSPSSYVIPPEFGDVLVRRRDLRTERVLFTPRAHPECPFGLAGTRAASSRLSNGKIQNAMSDGEIPIRVVDNRNRDDLLKVLLLVILIIVFPPAAVAVQANECNVHVWISLVLMLFFVIPAYIHAVWYVFLRKPKELTIA